jgi:hypothetical protein
MKYLWYAFLGVFVITGLSLVVLNSAGVIFGLGLLGFAAALQIAWVALHHLKQLTAASRDNTDILAHIAFQSERTTKLLEQIANEPLAAPQPMPKVLDKGVAND